MDREEIIRMAREARAAVDVRTDPNSRPSWWAAGHNDVWERFAELVAAKEREACGRKPLTSAQMAAGREAIFSTGNPYCPCDAKTFRKVAEWVERHHGITGVTDGQPT